MKLIRKYMFGIIFIIPILLLAQHWTNDIRITDNPSTSLTSVNNARCIAIESESIIHMVWMDDRDGNFEIYYARSTDYGTTWPENYQKRLTQTKEQSTFPAIAVSDSSIHVVWIEETGPQLHSGEVFYTRSVDGGNTWGEVIRLDGELPNRFPSITADEIGNVNIVWLREQQPYPKIMTKHSSDYGTGWAESETIYTGGTIPDNEMLGKPSISWECFSSRVHVAVTRFRLSDDEMGERIVNNIIYIKSNNYGVTWEEPQIIATATYYGDPGPDASIAAFNEDVHIVWGCFEEHGTLSEYFIYHVCSHNGGNTWSTRNTLYNSNYDLLPSAEFSGPRPSITIDQANIVHLIWNEINRPQYPQGKIYYTKSFDRGTTWESAIELVVTPYGLERPHIECYKSSLLSWDYANGIYIMWMDYRNRDPDIYFKRGWQIGENASCPNQGRHIDRTVNTENCSSVFQGENGLFWQSTEQTQSLPPVGLCDGKYPSVAVTPEGSSWICYTTETEQGQQLKCSIKRSEDSYDWKEIPLFEADSIFAPSLIFATTSPGAPGYNGNLGYVVCTIKDNDDYQMWFRAFDSLGIYYQIPLAHGNIDNQVSRPSIAITPKDFIQIGWQKTEEGTNRIYYITTLEPITPDDIRHNREPQWSDQQHISYVPGYQTEPASNPFVEAYGDQVYVVWRGPYDEGNSTGEIWQRIGQIWPGHTPIWQNPWNVSESPDKESDCPVQSTHTSVAWQELEDNENWEVKLRFFHDDVRNISNTESPSKYPHINVRCPEYETPHIYFIWTETNAPDIYELKFRDYEYIPEKSNPNEIIYYSVNTGDSVPSFYNEHRDGYIRYPNFPIDFGQSQLRYRLDYLNPAYYYKAKAIAYHNMTGRFKQTLSFDSIPVDTIGFNPGRPETVEVYVPQSTYNQDLRSILRVNRSRGNFSAMASFGLQQFEIIGSKGKETGPQSVINTPLSLITVNNYPNPFNTNTKILFSLSIPTQVKLNVYNSAGRLVRTLVNENKQAGIYKIIWDGTDNQKRLISAGIYFYRLETDNASQTKKVSIIR